MSILSWPSSRIDKVKEAFNTIEELKDHLWVSRGQSKIYGDKLTTLFDRTCHGLNRQEKLDLERESIELFRKKYSPYNYLEQKVIPDSKIFPLMIMQHHGIPTRLMDWTTNPAVALFFAVSCEKALGTQDNDDKDGELWTFSNQQYLKEGSKQWQKFPETLGWDGNFDRTLKLLFSDQGPENEWLVMQVVNPELGFNRLMSQGGIFTVTSKFNMDHAKAIAKLLGNKKCYHRYIISKEIKPFIRKNLRDKYNFTYDTLFPDMNKLAPEISAQVFYS